MSRLQEHFLEKLAYQNEQRRLKEEALKQFEQTSDTDMTDMAFTTDTNYTTNYDDEDVLATEDEDMTAPNTPKSIVSSISRQDDDTSPINTFAYPDDQSTPFHLPPRDRSETNISPKKSNSISPKKNKKIMFNPPMAKGLTAANLSRHDAALTASSMINTSTSSIPSLTRPITPSKTQKPMKYIATQRNRRRLSDAVYLKKSNKSAMLENMNKDRVNLTRHGSHNSLTKLRITQSISNPGSPVELNANRGRAQTHMALQTPQASAGAYRLGMFYFCELAVCTDYIIYIYGEYV